MKISFLVATRHRPEFLLRALRSVAEQTCSLKDVEVIVVHDGAPSAGPPIIPPEFPFARPDWPVVQYHEQVQQGKSAAMNAAFAHSAGEYICIMDDDDFIHPQKFEHMAQILDRDFPERIDVLWGLPQYVDPVGQPTCRTPNLPDRFMLENAWMTWEKYARCPVWAVHGTACMYRRAVWEKAGPWDVELEGCEEYEFHLRILRQGAVFHGYRQVTDYYRIHPGQKSGRKARRTAARLASRQRVRDKIEGWLKEGVSG